MSILCAVEVKEGRNWGRRSGGGVCRFFKRICPSTGCAVDSENMRNGGRVWEAGKRTQERGLAKCGDGGGGAGIGFWSRLQHSPVP